MNFKKRVNGSWHDIPHYIHNTSTDTITTLPAVLYPNAVTATVGLKGDMSQSGTPTHDNPIMPEGCGDITANMLSVYKENYSINTNGVETYNNVAMIYKANVIVLGSTFTLNFGGLSGGDVVRIHAYTGDTWKGQIAAIAITQVPFAFTVASEVDNIRISIRKTAINVTLTDGQYKIPISSANTTTPVYLGEVETTRQVKKVVLTGEEQFLPHQTIASWFQLFLSDIVIDNLELCTHYTPSPFIPATIQNGEILVGKQTGSDKGRIIIRDTAYTTAADFKTYLAQQYSNGTPVCVWYVLAEPTTGIVNEPLRKIGTYADTVSGITIPTIAGANTISVDTTLQPSEVTVNYKGWHPVQSVHERDNDQWD